MTYKPVTLAVALTAFTISCAQGTGDTPTETSRTLQTLLDKQYDWLRRINTLEVTVQATSAMNTAYRRAESRSSATLWLSGDRFRLEKIIHFTGKGGKPETDHQISLFDGHTYFTQGYQIRTAGEANIADKDKFESQWNKYFIHPYGATRLPFFEIFSFAQPKMQSLPALQQRDLWQASRFEVNPIRQEETSSGPATLVPFLFDHGQTPYLVETTITFPEKYGYLPAAFSVKLTDKATSAVTTKPGYQLSNWTTFRLDATTSVTLPLQSVTVTGMGELSDSHRESLVVHPDDIRINRPIPDSVFTQLPIPDNYQHIDLLTGNSLTSDTEKLKRWNNEARLLSCDECAQTTAPEYLPRGDLDVSLRLESTTSQSLEGLPYHLYYRYGNCCILLKEGNVPASHIIPLGNIPGKRDYFEYPLHIGASHVATLEPETSGILTVKVPAMVSHLMPDYPLTDILTSQTTSLSAFKGKRLVLDFWGVNCPPCRPALIKLNAFANGLVPAVKDNIVFLAATGHYKETEVRKFISDNNLTALRHFWIADDTYNFMGSEGIPYTVFVDESGKIVWRGNPDGDKYEKYLQSFAQTGKLTDTP